MSDSLYILLSTIRYFYKYEKIYFYSIHSDDVKSLEKHDGICLSLIVIQMFDFRSKINVQ
jgi:hypothetical protein